MSSLRRPSSIPARAVGEWNRALKLLRDRGEFLASRDVPLLERLIVNRHTARTLHREALRTPFVDGSTGQLVPHPGFAVAARCDRVALELGRVLNLTPDLFGAAVIDDPSSSDDGTPFDALDELAPRRRARTS
jgi:hypothetical protein